MLASKASECSPFNELFHDFGIGSRTDSHGNPALDQGIQVTDVYSVAMDREPFRRARHEMGTNSDPLG